ncbi:MAG TPA: bacterial transcriptional activator domain-containing protein [Candidatus Dormibacteraeota bacterium]|nr:bacterial transcriptional activator domain-containing protein [Candidatus Dormibacteraeota bacterium]
MANLRSALWRVHQVGCPVADVSATHLGLARDVTVDVHEVSSQAHTLIGGSVSEPLALDHQALSVDILPDWYDEWIIVERERYRQLRLQALEILAERAMAVGRLAESVEIGLAAVAVEPLRESAQRQLVKAHLANGNVAAALRQYHSYRQLLYDELGLQPSPLMRELIDGLATQP